MSNAPFEEQGKKAVKRSANVVSGEQDDRALSHDEFQTKAVFHAYRLLSGCPTFLDDEGVYTIRSGGSWYFLTTHQMDLVKTIVDAVKAQICTEEGRNPPFNIEDQILLLDTVQRRTRIEFGIPRERLRVMFVRMDTSGCGFYRIIQPVQWLQIITGRKEGFLHCEETNFVAYAILANVDVIVVPRQATWYTLTCLQALKRAGKIIVYETDDLLNKIPDWNPAKEVFDESDFAQRRDLVMKLADHFIVSTPELKDHIGKPESTSVVFNGIDHRLWPMQVEERPDSEPVNILWAGSDTHSRDLTLIVPTLKKLMVDYKGKIILTFVGYMPEEFKVTERRKNIIDQFVKEEYANQIRFVDGCAVQLWPQLLARVKPDICLAPLVDCEFNRCKSELKVLEAWALGCPIVASRIAPYTRAIDHGENGFLCREAIEWDTHLRNLIQNKRNRQAMAVNGIGKLRRKYTMDRLVYQMESALIKIALENEARIGRKECGIALRERMEDMQYESNFGTGDDQS